MSLVLRDIRHSYGSGVVVDGASLEAAPGEIVALFGPSGCGKTTLLRIAAGLEPLQHGAVELDGAPLASPHLSVPAEKRPIGFVLQDFVLFPHLTIARNVAFGLSHLTPAERATRVAAELALVDLAGFDHRYPHQLSGGQQQRAALARAFARQPRAMLLDEPFASIDVALRSKLRGELRRILKARGAPAIFVTHDPGEAIEVGDRIAIMRGGRIIEAATPERLYNAPQTLAGATIFPGAQAIVCRAAPRGVATAFGEFPEIERTEDAAHLVLHGPAAAAFADKAGPARVADCRFLGPDWQIALTAPEAPGVLLRAGSAIALEIGAPARVEIDPRYVRVLG